jgi:hypothetical protein
MSRRIGADAVTNWTPGGWIQGRKERYRIRSRLASPGAYGELWQVQDEAGRTWLAKRALPVGRADLLREIAFAEREAAGPGTALSAPIHDVAADLADPFFVRRLYDGDLSAWKAAGPSLAERFQVLADVGEAVRRLHARGVVLRDLKPDNVLYLRFPDRVQPILADVSLYRELGRASGTGEAAQTGRGTPDFMAWEAGLRGRPVTAAVDVFAFGAMVYDVLVGERSELASRHQAALTVLGHRAQELSRVGRLSEAGAEELGGLVAREDAELVALGELTGFPERDRRRLERALGGGTVVGLDVEVLAGAIEGALVGDVRVRGGALAALVGALQGGREVVAAGAEAKVAPARRWVLDPPEATAPPSMWVPSGEPSADPPAPGVAAAPSGSPVPVAAAPPAAPPVAPLRPVSPAPPPSRARPASRWWPLLLAAAAVLLLGLLLLGFAAWRAWDARDAPVPTPGPDYHY